MIADIGGLARLDPVIGNRNIAANPHAVMEPSIHDSGNPSQVKRPPPMVPIASATANALLLCHRVFGLMLPRRSNDRPNSDAVRFLFALGSLCGNVPLQMDSVDENDIPAED